MTTPSDKNRSKRRQQRQKERRQQSSRKARREKAESFLEAAWYYMELKQYEKAETFLRKVLKQDPENRQALTELARLGKLTNNEALIKDSFLQLHRMGLLQNAPLENEAILNLCKHLLQDNEPGQAAEIAADLKARQADLKVRKRKSFEKDLDQIIALAEIMQRSEGFLRNTQPGRRTGKVKAEPYLSARKTNGATFSDEQRAADRQSSPSDRPPNPDQSTSKLIDPSIGCSAPDIPLILEMEGSGIAAAFSDAFPASREQYDLVMDAVRLRFKETFDHLLCLSNLQGITSLAYQEETARKILKTFRGRALLADEVGMGKTIEACMVLKEYWMRRMIRNILILTPTPLVSQWQEELRSKFGMDFVSTDDRDFRTLGDAFWQQPHIVASVNIAKSKKNFTVVADRDWDLVIADEAHHFKNHTTQNWKLLNILKKRFLLMLTATPVENNLMELYNLITLLKPGQLKTSSAFKEEFMTRGDPTDPKNRTRLKGLLDQVMIRNTRAVANIQIPPRFAETIRTEPVSSEIELYERVSDLVRGLNASEGPRNRMVLKHLLAEAGSSPAAVEKTLSEFARKQELPARLVEEIRAIRNLTRSMGDTGKNKMAIKLIQSAHDKIIVFVTYRATLDHLSDVLTWSGIGHSVFHGQMSNPEKERAIEQFRTEHDVLLTTEIGGEGRNLQFCCRMINYDLPWNPMRIEQRIGRIHRIGQTREVMIYNLCAAETVEDYILDILDRKINMFEMVIGEIDMIIGRMRDEQDFSDMVYDIWINTASDNDRKAAFDKLAARLKRCKTGYERTKSLDDKLFGENYEI